MDSSITFYVYKDPIIKCSKCKSDNIAKPANESKTKWVFKCLDCGHTKEKEAEVITVYSWTKYDTSNIREF